MTCTDACSAHSQVSLGRQAQLELPDSLVCVTNCTQSCMSNRKFSHVWAHQRFQEYQCYGTHILLSKFLWECMPCLQLSYVLQYDVLLRDKRKYSDQDGSVEDNALCSLQAPLALLEPQAALAALAQAAPQVLHSSLANNYIPFHTSALAKSYKPATRS